MIPPLELIEWLDITSHSNEWFSQEELRSFDAWKMYTAGWVVEETDTVLKVVSTHSDPAEDDVTYGHDTIIPKGYVIDRKVLRKRWDRARKKSSKING